MAPWTLFAALVASFALQSPPFSQELARLASVSPFPDIVDLATRQTCVDDPCESVFCIATTNPTIIPGFGGACSTCECVPIQECPENPCEDTFCIATTNPTIIPGLGGACSTCECVPIGA
ncbi:hypothetical protein BKA70DRAFT_1229787 [Coprinopsis sp. MPI-PUGE-AT-0042]|nr:hypothetical protein BKA70DRAFT_1229787 [Coprinopsis sp. MPI-PUGE-AT-0042]